MGKSSTVLVAEASAQVVGQATLYIGLDVHKDLIVGCALPYAGKPVDEQRVPNEPSKLRAYLAGLAERFGARLVVAYEAGICGYSLCRLIQGFGHECHVVAPSVIPHTPAEKKRKTDRRDAFKIARGLRAGDLTYVRIPAAEDEASRDLLRLRSDLKGNQREVRNRIHQFLLRKGCRYGGGKPWTRNHIVWLRKQKFDTTCEQIVLDEYMAQLFYLDERLSFVEKRLAELAASPRYCRAAEALQVFKGVSMLTAMTLILEIVDFRRFASAPQLMAYLGLVPSEFSSGPGKQKLGRITKAGSPYCRHVLVEAAWKYRRTTSPVADVAKRRKGAPAALVSVALKADKRLHTRFLALSQRKPSGVAVVAVARELVGFIWAAGSEVELGK